MSATSTIEWTDATWNPVTGCSVQSPGCKNCYAMKLAGTRLRFHPSRAGLTRESAAGPVWTGETRFIAEWLEQPLQWTRARMIFVCAHGDLFHPSVPDEWIDQVFAVMALARRHTFQVLTKQPQRAAEYFAHPVREALIGQHVSRIHLKRTGDPVVGWSGLPLPNVWFGISAEDQRRLDERLPHLLGIQAAVRYLSLEPLLGSIQLDRRLLDPIEGTSQHGQRFVDWVIVGGESGHGARPMHPAWARSLRDQCRAAGVAFFFKQWGEWAEAWGSGTRLIYADGTVLEGTHEHPDAWKHKTAEVMRRVGKKAAGRTLDGRTWDEVPR